MERYIERVKKSIADKEPPLKVAETRLKKRTQAGSGNFPPKFSSPPKKIFPPLKKNSSPSKYFYLLNFLLFHTAPFYPGQLFMITANPLELFPPECLVLTRCSPLTPPYLGNQTLSSIIKQQAGLVFLKCLRKLVWVLFLHFPPKILRACFCVPIFQSWV